MPLVRVALALAASMAAGCSETRIIAASSGYLEQHPDVVFYNPAPVANTAAPECAPDRDIEVLCVPAVTDH